jgi:hypothetical protein
LSCDSWSHMCATMCPIVGPIFLTTITMVGLETGRPEFDMRQRQRNCPLACVQTISEAHPASYPKGAWGPFPGVKRGRGVTLTTYPI